eukprot:GILJ01004500.1.p1 GENE.GILJ01004500.1~~GILJ01004500.1.p1  ORF type:complete len:774 (+),score=166.84 GILJ01004500.1:37-2358(+)
MRIAIKGGVWKNTEDEILKAAVMKYGLNQWARISSLLVRKSAKQCKARWYEWLDPSIKKTEWTREEDEKLLHLAKLFPTQWRTIAPSVGRTAAQCLDRYEQLLDMAQGKEENEDDPRKLKPGEIDPQPETKPARPDPVDMDEDEKEMLSEARARVANTRGKKAKRKAREKQLEEAKRLAAIQKRRELKAAGLDFKNRRRVRGIDYNAEVPFEKRPPPGFYQAGADEEPKPDPSFAKLSIQQLEGKRRDEDEARRRREDTKRMKKMEQYDMAAAIMKQNQATDPLSIKKRSKLVLPAPQLSERELEEIVKSGYAGEEGEAGGEATKALMGNYSTAAATPTPMRTPRTHDSIMQEAMNAVALRNAETPLQGGENTPLHPSDFSGVTPKRAVSSTPNRLATPSTVNGAGMTPSRGGSASVRRTPIRDSMGINEESLEQEAINKREEKQRLNSIRQQLRTGLKSLPKPVNAYEIVMPDLPEEEDTAEQAEEDAEERLARERRDMEEKEQALLRKRSQVVQRDLPRPFIVYPDAFKVSTEPTTKPAPGSVDELKQRAESMLMKEMLNMVTYDAVKYPVNDPAARIPKKAPTLDDFEESEIRVAHELLQQEVDVVKTALGHGKLAYSAVSKAWEDCYQDFIYLPEHKQYGLFSTASVKQRTDALQQMFEITRQRVDEEVKRVNKLESRLTITTGGYQKRNESLRQQIETLHSDYVQVTNQLDVFRTLQAQETGAIRSRIESLKAELEGPRNQETALQARYSALIQEKERIETAMLRVSS